jgi:hypothetical protein
MTCEVVESRYDRILFQVEFDSTPPPRPTWAYTVHLIML